MPSRLSDSGAEKEVTRLQARLSKLTSCPLRARPAGSDLRGLSAPASEISCCSAISLTPTETSEAHQPLKSQQ